MDLVERVKAIVLKPDAEWPVIAREPGDVQFLFTNYVAILALIPAIAGFIGTWLIGPVASSGLMRPPFFAGVFAALLGYVFTFVMVYVVALLIDALAPTFGGQRNVGQALKLAVYSFTPFWLAGIFLILPGLRFLSVLGFYGFYLMYLGLPVLMRAPQERALVYTVAVVAFAFFIVIILGLIQAAVM